MTDNTTTLDREQIEEMATKLAAMDLPETMTQIEVLEKMGTVLNDLRGPDCFAVLNRVQELAAAQRNTEEDQS